jgi:hypothetical protein
MANFDSTPAVAIDTPTPVVKEAELIAAPGPISSGIGDVGRNAKKFVGEVI